MKDSENGENGENGTGNDQSIAKLGFGAYLSTVQRYFFFGGFQQQR